MKKLTVITVSLLTATLAFADGAAAKLAEVEKKADAAAAQPKNSRAELESRPAVLKKTGGFIDVAPKGTAIAVLDARAKSGGAADQFATVFADLSKMNVKVEKTPLAKGQCPVEAAQAAQRTNKAVFVLAIEDGDARRAGLTVLPEEGVVVINAAKYQGGPDPVQCETRIVKELWRGLGFVSGIGYPSFKNDVFQPVSTVAELDALEYQVMQPMNFQKMYEYMKDRGIHRARHVPYRVAVMEGWAAQPTNDYQKAIWNEIHATPTKPMKIEFDPAKGR